MSVPVIGGSASVTTTVGILGPLVVMDRDGRTLPPLAPRLRRLLAGLAVADGEVVSIDRLAEIVFGDGPPSDPTRSLQTYVSRLRSSLGGDSDAGDALVERIAPGYRLGHAARTDAADFVSFVGVERAAATPIERLHALDEALARWRGPALVEFADQDWARPTAVRLEEQRLDALERRAMVRLDLGRSDDSVGELQALVGEHPLREGFWSALMRALAQSGRQAEALRAFQDYRAWLATEVGLEPSDELAALERRIATGKPSLAEPNRSRLRSYELHEVIGEGAFAVVWRGTEPHLDRDVAIKEIRAELANRPEFIRRFEAEAQLIAHLEHPYVVPLYDYWREPDSAYLVMRYLQGGTLATLVDERTLTVDELRRLVEQVGSALATAHRAGIVHRDVKPGNVFLDGDGNFFLGDFGIAHLSSVAPQPEDALSPGTPAYAAPEQLRREAVGPPADVHGLACTVYEALTARLPFHEPAGHGSILARRSTGEFPSVRDVRADVPVGVDDVLARATAVDPGQRYADAGAFADALLGAVRDGPGAGGRERGGRDVRATVIGDSLLRSIVDRNPYKGLQAFGEADVDDFFGRERLVDRLVERLAADGAAGRLAVVVGPSGSGKSSVVRAGLVPAVRSGGLAGSDGWFVTTMTPGRAPFEEMEEALLRVATVPRGDLVGVMTSDPRGITRAVKQCVPDDTELVLVVDQFEELFTLCPDEAVRSRFLDGLVEAVTDDRSRVRLVLTMRADFVDRPLRYPGLGPLFERATVMVSPLAPDELERAIVEPAARLGMSFEPGLVSEIVADVLDQPGALPLLQYALTELFEQQVSGMLTESAYRDLGGLSGALAARAEELFVGFGEAGQATARRLFPRLVTLGEGTEDTRRRVRRRELDVGAEAAAVIDAFGAARLLSFDRDPETREPTVEVAHEALLREWPRLRGWIDDDRDALRVHRHLTDAAVAWEERGEDDGDLYRGARLDGAVDLLAIRPDDLNAGERRFVEESVAAATAVETRRRRQNRRLRGALLGAAVLLVMALVAGLVAVGQRNDARESAFESETVRLGVAVTDALDTDPSIALVLAAEGYRREPGPETLGALQRVLVGADRLLGVVAAGQFTPTVVFLGDDELAVVVDGELRSYSLAGEHLRTYGAGRLELGPGVDWPRSLVTSPAGDRLLIIDRDRVLVFDTDTGNELLVLDGGANTAAFSADGRTLYVGDHLGSVREVDVASGSVTRSWLAHPPEQVSVPEQGSTLDPIPLVGFVARQGVLGLAVRDDVVVTLGGLEVRTWARNDLSPLDRSRAAFTAGDGRELVGDVERLHPAVEGDPIAVAGARGFGVVDPDLTLRFRSSPIFERVALPVRTIALTQARRQAFLLGNDNTVRVVDLGTLGVVDEIDIGRATANDVAASADGTRLAVATSEGVVLFGSNGDRLLASAAPMPTDTETVHVWPDGRTVAMASFELGRTQVLDLVEEGWVRRRVAPERELGWLSPVGSEVEPSVSSEWMAIDQVGQHRWVDRRTLEPLGAWIPDSGSGMEDLSRGRSITAPFGPLFVGRPPELRRYAFPSGEPIGSPIVLDEPVGGVVPFYASPAFVDEDGAAVVNSDAGVFRVDLDTSEILAGPPELAAAPVLALRADADRQFVFVTRLDGSVEVRRWNDLDLVTTVVEAAPPTNGDPGPYVDRQRELLLSLSGGAARLFGLANGRPVGGDFPSTNTLVVIGGWDGTQGRPMQLVTAVDDVALVWNLDTDTWFDIACGAAGRNLTEEEWERVGPRDSDYVATCPQWPAGGSGS